MPKFDPSNPYDRFLDLQKQGFMKSVYKVNKPKKTVKPVVIVACDYCIDWHPKNKHTASKEQRESNVKEKKAKDPTFKPQQRVIG